MPLKLWVTELESIDKLGTTILSQSQFFLTVLSNQYSGLTFDIIFHSINPENLDIYNNSIIFAIVLHIFPLIIFGNAFYFVFFIGYKVKCCPVTCI